MYLWSIDIDAVLTAMSCFHLLCEEADIRCGADEMAVTQLLPNYTVYSELAAAATVLTTGRAALQKRIMALLRKIDQSTPGTSQVCVSPDSLEFNCFLFPYLTKIVF